MLGRFFPDGKSFLGGICSLAVSSCQQWCTPLACIAVHLSPAVCLKDNAGRAEPDSHLTHWNHCPGHHGGRAECTFTLYFEALLLWHEHYIYAYMIYHYLNFVFNGAFGILSTFTADDHVELLLVRATPKWKHHVSQVQKEVMLLDPFLREMSAGYWKMLHCVLMFFRPTWGWYPLPQIYFSQGQSHKIATQTRSQSVLIWMSLGKFFSLSVCNWETSTVIWY